MWLIICEWVPMVPKSAPCQSSVNQSNNIQKIIISIFYKYLLIFLAFAIFHIQPYSSWHLGEQNISELVILGTAKPHINWLYGILDVIWGSLGPHWANLMFSKNRSLHSTFFNGLFMHSHKTLIRMLMATTATSTLMPICLFYSCVLPTIHKYCVHTDCDCTVVSWSASLHRLYS